MYGNVITLLISCVKNVLKMTLPLWTLYFTTSPIIIVIIIYILLHMMYRNIHR